MPTPQHVSNTSTVVELAGFRRQYKNCTNTKRIERTIPITTNRTAELLSLRQHLGYQASVEIDKLQHLHNCYGQAFRNSVERDVRALLDKEFGHLRVHRYRNLFIVRHRSVEGLISSLLRIQFHTQQRKLPATTLDGEHPQSSAKAVTLTWGVGRTSTEAEVERLKRRRQKFRR